MKLFFITIAINIIYYSSFAQTNNTFFPHFQAYPLNPIIKYGDHFSDAAWNDPCVIKENGQYVMYITAAIGISGTNPVKVYRQISTDGYHWTLSPSTPVLEPLSGTYYGGGTETPSVVFKDNKYHMYLTCYPAGNISSDFVIAHATSTNGINWTMDATPIIESDGSATIYGTLVGEPGAVVYHDSIYVYYTSAGSLSGNPIQCIGLMKSKDGTIFSSPKIAMTLPLDVYPLSSNYWGLSTPSALSINDSIYLYTDVAQMLNGTWTQVALHQFKTDGISGIWHHDTIPIHTKQDFNWTNGTFLSAIAAITPLMDDNGLLRIWYAGSRLADVSGSDTTYHLFFDTQGNMHVDPNYWGIGTSEYQFPNTNDLSELRSNQHSISMYPNPTSEIINIKSSIYLKNATITLMDVSSQTLKKKENIDGYFVHLNVNELHAGLYFIEIKDENGYWIEKLTISR